MMAILYLCQCMELLSVLKKIWDEWAWMYGTSSNIALIVVTFEKIFKLKGFEGAIKDVYALLHGFLTLRMFIQA